MLLSLAKQCMHSNIVTECSACMQYNKPESSVAHKLATAVTASFVEFTHRYITTEAMTTTHVKVHYC